MFVLPQAKAGQQNAKSSDTTAQADKILYDHGVADIRKNRFEVGRMQLQTLINTYTSSEYLPKAELAIAQSWFKEGGAHGRDQAQAECKQLTQQFPGSPEAKEAAELLRKLQESTEK
jgi:outer membrane protein assembly factor BamD